LTASLAQTLAAKITGKSSANFDPEHAATYSEAIDREFAAQGLDPLTGYVLAMSQTKFMAQANGGVWKHRHLRRLPRRRTGECTIKLAAARPRQTNRARYP
jgi:hypothetical protein